MANRLLFQLEIDGPERAETLALPPGVTRLGRVAGNDLELPHHFVSGRHAQIVCDESSCVLTDLGSTNGTVVDGEKLPPQTPRPLTEGTAVQIGPYRLVLRVSTVAEPEPEPEPEAAPPIVVAPSAGEVMPASSPPIPVIATPPPPPTPPSPPAIPADPAAPPPGLTHHSERLLNYLPAIYHTDFMARFLGIFESILTPIEWTVDNFDLYLGPSSAPADFLPWLANWYAMSFDTSWSETQRRAFLAEAYDLYARRGTRAALQRVLQIYTGARAEIVDQEADQDPFVFTVRLPMPANQVNRALIEQLIDMHKPAHASYRLLFAQG
ncbi:MAG: phage tail protein I [Ardenticatenales bacterium]|nr:phage tail protein I [Ardenticatenales bacterium]